MAYNPVKQFLVLIALSLTWQPCQAMARLAAIPGSYYFFMGTHVYQAHRETLILAEQNLPKYKRAWLRCPDAHSDVQAFIREQLNATPDKQLLNNLSIKQVEMQSNMAAMHGGIAIRSDNHDELLAVLTKKKHNEPLTQEEQDVLSFHAVVSKHEFGHLKHKDLFYERLFHPAVSITLQGLTWAFTKLCSCEKYYKPSSYAEDQWSIDIIKGGLFLAATGIVQGFIHKKLSDAYSKHLKEKRAQQYAVDHTRNTETLRGFASYMGRERIKKAHEWTDRVIEELDDNLSIRPYFKFYCHCIHRNFLAEHPDFKKSRYTQEALAAFRKWLLRQGDIIDKLDNIFDPKHPSYAESIKQAQQAAENLEKSTTC
jgi:hypothetical protein